MLAGPVSGRRIKADLAEITTASAGPTPPAMPPARS